MDIIKPKIFFPAIIILIIFLASLYIFAISPYWKITPDNTVYIGAAESIAAGKGYLFRGRPAYFFPPVSSLIYSIFIFFFSKDYIVLNSVVKIFSLFSIFFSYMLFKKYIGRGKSLVIILLVLGNIYLFEESTRLLSDIFYMFFSILSLIVIIDLFNKKSNLLKYFLAVILISTTCLTRLIGVAIPIACIISALLVFYKKRDNKYIIISLLMLIPILITFLWDIRNFIFFKKCYFLGYFVKKEIGYHCDIMNLTLIDGVLRVVNNFKVLGEKVANIFLNIYTIEFPFIYVVLYLIILVFLFLGLLVFAIQTSTLISFYVIIYLSIFFLRHSIRLRYLIPILPFLFYFTFFGIKHILCKQKGIIRTFAIKFLYIILPIYIFSYFIHGINAMKRTILEEHNSPFGAYPIKYEHHYDLQKLALWLKDNLSKEETYICLQPQVAGIITEGKGRYFPPVSDKSKIMEYIDKKHISYVLVNKKKIDVQNYLIPVIETYPDRFELIKDEKDASLYKVEYGPVGNSSKNSK